MSDRIRNFFSSLGGELRDKRLIPVLILLVAAAVAIPLLLSKSGHAANVAPLPPAPSVTVPTPAATTTAIRHPSSQNYLTGPAHDPFAATSTTTTASGASGTGQTSTASAASAKTGGSSSKSNSGGSTGSGGATTQTVTVTKTKPTTTVTKTTTVKTKTPLPYTDYQVEVSILQSSVDSPPTVTHNVARDQLLPNDTGFVAAFLGVLSDKRTAVFILPDVVTATGSGQCAPSASDCRFLELQPGDTVNLVSSPSGEPTTSFTLSYNKVTPVKSTASTITTDPVGAHDVDEAKAYSSALSSIHYAPYTGLLSIDTGPTVPANS